MSFRLYYLPISTRRALVYALPNGPRAAAPGGLVDRAARRANGLWAKWEHSDVAWQQTVVRWGNKAFARIPYAEWGLKSVPPLTRRAQRAAEAGGAAHPPIAITYPRFLVPRHRVIERVRALASGGLYWHRKRMWWCLAGMPLTLPFALIPIVPNLPFFYLAFRAWSHWKALAGSRQLELLLRHRRLETRSSAVLLNVYRAPRLTPERLRGLREACNERPQFGSRVDALLPAVRSDVYGRQKAAPDEEMAATDQTGQLLSMVYQCPPLEIDMDRARTQVLKLMQEDRDRGESEPRKRDSGSKE